MSRSSFAAHYLAAASIVSLSLIASTAHASGSHTLIARAHNAAVQAISFPETTTFVEATHEQGVAGVNDHIHNHAEVNSDTGHLALRSTSVQSPPGNTIQPNSWNMGAVLEENAIYSVKPDGTHSAVGLRASFNLPTAEGKVTHVTGITMTLTARLSVDECVVGATRTVSYSNEGVPTTSDLVSNGGCSGAQGVSGRLEGSTLYVEVPNFGKVAPIVASLGITFSYAGNFTGSIDTALVGDLKVEGIDGVPEFASPTFGSKAPGAVPPTNTPPPNSSGGPPGGADGGASSINLPPGAAGPAGESDEGCNVGRNSPSTMAPSTAGSLGLAIALAALVRRVRHRRRR
jgi:hypothetical protein